MSRKKAFFISFIISMIWVFVIYRGIWAAVQNRSSETDTPLSGVPKNTVGLQDTKTVFVGLGDKDNPYFFLLKLSAINNRIGICCISPSYEYSDSTSLRESFGQAGIMQCLLDTEEEFDMDIDYYLWCSWEQAATLTSNMNDIGIDSLGEDMPPVIRDFLLESAEKISGQTLVNCARKAAGFLDNEIGLAFLTESIAQLIINNPQQLTLIAQEIKENYSSLVTNMNTTSLAGMARITDFLEDSYVEYPRQIILKGDTQAKEKIDMIME